MKENESLNINFVDITNLISIKEFEAIKEFILNNGDKMTYRNFDSNNPHYKFLKFDTFLGADVGQRNMNNNPLISDFNQLTIADRDSNIRYYELIILRKGDIKAGKSWIRNGMKEDHIYLVDVYSKGLERMEINLPNYLKQIKEKINSH